jgi:hypothetical protein
MLREAKLLVENLLSRPSFSAELGTICTAFKKYSTPPPVLIDLYKNP